MPKLVRLAGAAVIALSAAACGGDISPSPGSDATRDAANDTDAGHADSGSCSGSAPVCGANSCSASRAGQAALCQDRTWVCPCIGDGAFPGSAPRGLSCGSCDPSTSYCSEGIGPVTAATCRSFASTCGATPSCACIETTCTGTWTCTVGDAGIVETCTYGGPGGEP